MNDSLADLVCRFLADPGASECDSPPADEGSAATPATIAAGIGIAPTDVRRRLDLLETLSELVDEGVLSETIHSVRDGRDRQYYGLTERGRERARGPRRERLARPADRPDPASSRPERKRDDPGVESSSAGDDPRPADESARRRPWRKPTDDRIVGREDELDTLRETLTSIRRRGGRTLVLSGDRGVGKTTLCSALLGHAADRDVARGRARCRGDTDEPFEPLRRAIEDAFGEPVPSSLSDPSATPVGDGASLAARRSALVRSVAETVCDRTIDRPTLLVVDGLQDADASTLALFERIASSAAAWVYQLLLVGTYRPREVGEATSLAATLARLSDHDRVDELAIEPFDRTETAHLVSEELGDDVAESVVDRVHESTGGTPLALSETLAWLADTRVDSGPSDAQDGSADELDLPAGLEQAFDRRIESLDDVGRAVLEAAAVLGDPIDGETVRSIVSPSDATVSTYVSLLVDARLLARADDEAIVFPSDVVRETVVDSLGVDRRRELHARAADALAAADAPPATIAHHRAEAGDLSRAVDRFQRAAERASRRYAGDTAIELYGRALDIATELGADRRIADLHLSLGETHVNRGAYDAAAERFRAALAQAADAEIESRARHRLAEIRVKRGDVEAGIATATTGLAAVTDAVPASDRCRLHRVLGWGRLQDGDLDGARVAFERQASVAAAADDPTLRALAEHDLGTLAGMTGDIDEAETRLSAAVSAFDRLEDPGHCAKSLTNLALVYRRSGGLDAALEANERALAIQREYGYLESLPDSRMNQAELRLARGDLALAVESYEAAIDAATDSGRQERAAMARTNLADVLTLQGRIGLGFHRCQEAIDAFEHLDASDGLGTAHASRARIYLIAGDTETACADAEHALSIARDLGNADRIADARDVRGRVARAMGELDAATTHHEAAASLAADGGNDVSSIQYRIELLADRLADRTAAAPSALLKDAKAVVAETTERVLEARARTRLARACRRCGEYDRAERVLDEAHRAQAELGVVVDRCETVLARSALERDTDRPTAAADSLGVANALIQEYGLECYADWTDRLRRQLE
ncbi:ATP-binding protein [Halovivax cerinus]|uniref:ATP-binding protein n=1 Tax=Halovivax cerinus TaxID=1487865 RepID=A0ABD5NMM8_9EURY|nr:tetratricopeptide repeat protein [Halovivax cerinus]